MGQTSLDIFPCQGAGKVQILGPNPNSGHPRWRLNHLSSEQQTLPSQRWCRVWHGSRLDLAPSSTIKYLYINLFVKYPRIINLIPKFLFEFWAWYPKWNCHTVKKKSNIFRHSPQTKLPHFDFDPFDPLVQCHFFLQPVYALPRFQKYVLPPAAVHQPHPRCCNLPSI